MCEGKSSKLPYKENEFFEDAIARQLQIIKRAQTVAWNIEDPDTLERVSGLLAEIVQKANATRTALIKQREKQKGRLEGE